jgi:hypothetical protein
VDGGYYDNYGMSTLVEWLDDALAEDTLSGSKKIKSMLVLQLHGAPVGGGDDFGKSRNRGWFFQAFAPFLTLNNVRGAGQIAHNDLELLQLQAKWFDQGVPIHSVTFEYPNDDGPLSWHLTATQQNNIWNIWTSEPKCEVGRKQVSEFLIGSDDLGCPCPRCNHPQGGIHTQQFCHEPNWK